VVKSLITLLRPKDPYHHIQPLLLEEVFYPWLSSMELCSLTLEITGVMIDICEGIDAVVLLFWAVRPHLIKSSVGMKDQITALGNAIIAVYKFSPWGNVMCRAETNSGPMLVGGIYNLCGELAFFGWTPNSGNRSPRYQNTHRYMTMLNMRHDIGVQHKTLLALSH